MQKISILGKTLDELYSLFLPMGFSKLDAKRVLPWIHVKLCNDFEEFSDLSISTRIRLKECFAIGMPIVDNFVKSCDGTCKAVLKFLDDQSVESVLIPEDKRCTICVSSQVGCQMGCKFCYTGASGFVRNLTSSEIMSQILFWKKRFPETTITNIVFMGMGEPLLNFDNLKSALTLLLDERMHNFSRKKITVSTVGIIDKIEKLGKEFGVKLAISLHTAYSNVRLKIMPIEKSNSLESLLEVVKNYPKISNTERVTFEYLLLNDINDSADDARNLAKLLSPIKCKVNLMMFNSWPGSRFHQTTQERSEQFQEILMKKKIMTFLRKSRGPDIYAACGQLKSEVV